MTRGPRPEPTRLKILRGNPGKRRLNDAEPQPVAGFPECPEHLDGVAREAWERFGADLAECGVGTKIDATALELLSTAYALYLDAAAKVASAGAVWLEKAEAGKIPTFTVSPYLRIMTDQQHRVHTLLAEFGMTPSSRSRVKMDKPKSGGVAQRTRA